MTIINTKMEKDGRGQPKMGLKEASKFLKADIFSQLGIAGASKPWMFCISCR
jgi:hypothetical protein